MNLLDENLKTKYHCRLPHIVHFKIRLADLLLYKWQMK